MLYLLPDMIAFLVFTGLVVTFAFLVRH
jgi:Flp pilus assembly pilin Flp